MCEGSIDGSPKHKSCRGLIRTQLGQKRAVLGVWIFDRASRSFCCFDDRAPLRVTADQNSSSPAIRQNAQSYINKTTILSSRSSVRNPLSYHQHRPFIAQLSATLNDQLRYVPPFRPSRSLRIDKNNTTSCICFTNRIERTTLPWATCFHDRLLFCSSRQSPGSRFGIPCVSHLRVSIATS